jgi:hypothetical protein
MAEEHDAARQEREMREHERQARERDPDERSPDGDSSPDPEAGAQPAPPGNIQAGGQSG